MLIFLKYAILNQVSYSLSLTMWRTLCIGCLEQCHWAIFHAPHRQMLGQAVKRKEKNTEEPKLQEGTLRFFCGKLHSVQRFCSEINNVKRTWWKWSKEFPSCVSFLCLKASAHCFLNSIQHSPALFPAHWQHTSTCPS